MAPRPDNPEPSSHNKLPDPCEKCQLTTCFSLHSYSASSCSYNICPECRALEALDAEIRNTHDILISLSKKRHDLKERINRRHDRLTAPLPLEVTTYIFTLVAGDSGRYKKAYPAYVWNPVFMLGAVCREWRNITLGMSQLWTKISINRRNLKHTSSADNISQWLSRSRAQPLSLIIDVACSISLPVFVTSNIAPLLRSQAHRLKDLTLRVPTAGPVLSMLLTGLKERLTVDSLDISASSSSPGDLDKLVVEYPVVTSHLIVDNVPLSHIPVQWDSLTRLTAECIGVNDLLKVFHCTRNLRYGFLNDIQHDTNHHPIPIPGVATLPLIQLSANIRGEDPITALLLRKLTLPSLEGLSYGMIDDSDADGQGMDALGDLLDRSQPPLREFDFYYLHQEPQLNRNWFLILPSITSLELIIDEGEDGELLQGYLERLGAHLEPLALPHLKNLTIRGDTMNPRSFDTLAAMFPDRKNSPSRIERPLKKVTISLDQALKLRKEIMRKTTYTRLRCVQKSGVGYRWLAECVAECLSWHIKLTSWDPMSHSSFLNPTTNLTMKFCTEVETGEDELW